MPINAVYYYDNRFMLVSTTVTGTYSTAWQSSLTLAFIRGTLKRPLSYVPYGNPIFTFTGPIKGYLDSHPEILL